MMEGMGGRGLGLGRYIYIPGRRFRWSVFSVQQMNATEH